MSYFLYWFYKISCFSSLKLGKVARNADRKQLHPTLVCQKAVPDSTVPLLQVGPWARVKIKTSLSLKFMSVELGS